MQKKQWDFELEENWVVLTVNRRLVRYIERRFDEKKLRQGRKIWPTPKIMPVTAWLGECWHALLDLAAFPDAILLDEESERVLWQRVVAESKDKGELLWSDSAALGAAQAWDILNSWNLEPPWEEAQGNVDAEAFARWAEDFQDICRKRGFLPYGKLPHIIAENLEKIPLPKGVILAGFDEIAPNLKQLFNRMEKLSIPMVAWAKDPVAVTPRRTSFADGDAEITAAAKWARKLLEDGEQNRCKTGEDAMNIAIVVPDLQARRSRIVRVFSDIFYPGRPQQAPFPEQSLFNLSLGAPLGDFAMIKDAMLLLQLARGEMEWRLCGSLLASPYWGGGDVEWTRRGLLDAAVRRLGMVSVGLSDLIREGEQLTSVTAGVLSDVEQYLGERAADDSKTPGAWALWFAGLLKVLRWPGERSLNSHEYQAMEAWRDLLNRFSGLEHVLGAVDLDRALEILTGLAKNTVFQPRESEAQVQVLGVLEAVGESFDAIWIMGLSEDAWPAIPEPNPFLPISFQQKHDLPRSSNQRELQYARRLTQQLLSSGNQIIVSYCEWDGEMAQRPSPLVSSLQYIDYTELIQSEFPTAVEVIFDGKGLENRNETQPAPFDEGAIITCGTSIIKSQVLCPFSAFARHRLHAEPLESPVYGFDGAQRGEITHRILADFWKEVKSSANLSSMSYSQREKLLYMLGTGAVSSQAYKSGANYSKEYLQLEVKRQKRLVLKWLMIEESRTTPFEVEECECPGTLEIGGLAVNFRIDRIDRVDSGERVIIDYKTGQVKTGHWFSERPQEPQMPLYALAKANGLAALAYGQMRPDMQGFVGLADQIDILPTVELLQDGRHDQENTDWPALLRCWAGVLQRLAEEYRCGVSRVDPLPEACDWCELASLCRISERRPILNSATAKEEATS